MKKNEKEKIKNIHKNYKKAQQTFKEKEEQKNNRNKKNIDIINQDINKSAKDL